MYNFLTNVCFLHKHSRLVVKITNFPVYFLEGYMFFLNYFVYLTLLKLLNVHSIFLPNPCLIIFSYITGAI